MLVSPNPAFVFLYFIATVLMPLRTEEIKVFVPGDEFCSTLVSGDDRKRFEPSVFAGSFRESHSVLLSALFILRCFPCCPPPSPPFYLLLCSRCLHPRLYAQMYA